MELGEIKSLYLAHPLNKRREIRELELEFEKETGIILFNPFYDAEGREDIERMDKGEFVPRTMTEQKSGIKIVERDLNAIEKQDGIVAFAMKGAESFGTPMEIFYSSRILRKPTYVITNDLSGHPWVLGLATKIYNTWEEFREDVRKERGR